MSKYPFKPAWWLPNSHFQTIWPVLCRRPVKLPTERERLELPDGDFLDLDWVKRNVESSEAPLIIMLHGLEGSIESHYARGMLKTITDHGWRGVFMHFRGCSGEPNRLYKNYHSGETGDLSYVVNLLQEREPDTQFAAVGFSLGGNVLLKWLGETGNKNPLSAAIGISVPFDLHGAAKRIQIGFSKLYQWYFLSCIRDRLLQKYENVSVPLDPGVIHQAKTFVDFDDKVTAPLHGFSGVDDYYTKSSSRQYLRSIEVPTLILHAKDDPLISADCIPKSHELSPKINLEVSETGGHVGFVTGNIPWRPEYWLEIRVTEFLEDLFKKLI